MIINNLQRISTAYTLLLINSNDIIYLLQLHSRVMKTRDFCGGYNEVVFMINKLHFKF